MQPVHENYNLLMQSVYYNVSAQLRIQYNFLSVWSV
jgi:hypothetical protein